MKVTKIRLVGFKSFADETIIYLNSGITGIVGPNGCGKSNIVDAVRWVLGEKSGRALRGKTMEDVIFLGSETRKPMGMAEVEIYFDNSDRTLSIDFDEVVIGRRIYLNSASEYYMNQKKITRKELDRIFMDTGIGKTAYSIMEQGKMAEILRSSPEEIRNVFDEAAGISRFKIEKLESLKKLEDTNQNLLRLNDILKEKEKELNQLEKQARKTKQYLQFKQYLDKHDLNIRNYKYNELKEKEFQISEKLKNQLNKKNQIFQNISSYELRIEELERLNQMEVDSIQQLEIEYHNNQNHLKTKQIEIQRIENEEQNIKQKLEQIQKRVKNETKYYKILEKKLQETLQIELNLGIELENIEMSIQNLEEKILNSENLIKKSYIEEENLQKQIELIEYSYNKELDRLKLLTQELLDNVQQKQEKLQIDEEKRRIIEKQIEEALNQFRCFIENIQKLLKNNLINEALNESRNLENLNIEEYFNEYRNIQKNLREIFFGEFGIFSKKEEIDKQMNQLLNKKKDLQNQLKYLIQSRRKLTEEVKKKKQKKIHLELLQRDYIAQKKSSLENQDTIKTQIEESKDRLGFLIEEEEAFKHQLENYANYRSNIDLEIKEIIEKIEKLKNDLELLKKNTNEQRGQISDLKKRIQSERDKIEKLLPEISQTERAEENVRISLAKMEEELYNDFQITFDELSKKLKDVSIHIENEKKEYDRIKTEIMALGQFNALAIEQYENSKKFYDEIIKQKEDIEKSEKNIKEIIQKIDSESTEIFLNTFEKIKKNFEEVFQILFNGGKAELILTDPDNLLESGVQIMVQPPGKKITSLSLLSGGEQNLTAIALMFAIYLVKPSPFCLLDEIDAPLDDTNINRFLKMLRQFSDKSQFVVITHNKITMAEANSLFGVTQEEPGISRIISVKLDYYKEKNAIL